MDSGGQIEESALRLPPPLRRPYRTLSQRRWGRTLIRLVEVAAADDVPGLAAEMAYRFLFALFPFLIFLAATLGFIGSRIGGRDLFNVVMGFIRQLAPAEVQAVMADWVSSVIQTQSPGLLTIGAAGALWGAAGGVGTLTKGLNRAYAVQEDRPFWRAQAIALLATLALAGMTSGGAVLITLGEWVDAHLRSDGWGVVPLNAWAQGPGVGLGLLLVLIFVYGVLPNARIRWWETLPGAILAAAAWVGLTHGFSLYVVSVGAFDRTFGSLGAVALLMLWMYVVGVILLLGGELNAVVTGHRADR